MARVLRWLGNLLIAVGLALVVLALASYGYAAVERQRVEQQLAQLQEIDRGSESQLFAPESPRVLPRGEAPGADGAVAQGGPRVAVAPKPPGAVAEGRPQVEGTAAGAPGAVDPGAAAGQGAGDVAGTEVAAPGGPGRSAAAAKGNPEIALSAGATAEAPASPPARPPARPSYAPAVRMKIPKAGIDAPVVEVGIVAGEFEVPKFAVGHYRDTARAGEPGNGVFAGHVSSIASGNVFATLGRVKAGDEILLDTAAGPVRYVVSEVRVVPRTYLEALAPTPDPVITLISCTGRWDWGLRDYLERLIVRAELAPDGASGAG